MHDVKYTLRNWLTLLDLLETRDIIYVDNYVEFKEDNFKMYNSN